MCPPVPGPSQALTFVGRWLAYAHEWKPAQVASLVGGPGSPTAEVQANRHGGQRITTRNVAPRKTVNTRCTGRSDPWGPAARCLEPTRRWLAVPAGGNPDAIPRLLQALVRSPRPDDGRSGRAYSVSGWDACAEPPSTWRASQTDAALLWHRPERVEREFACTHANASEDVRPVVSVPVASGNPPAIPNPIRTQDSYG
jgi:hypothetical protein